MRLKEWNEKRIEHNKKKIIYGLEMAVKTFLKEDWDMITTNNYRTNLENCYKNLLKLADKYDVPTKDYETRIIQGGFNIR